MNLPDNILEKKYAVYIRETTKKVKAYTNWAWLFSAKVLSAGHAQQLYLAGL